MTDQGVQSSGWGVRIQATGRGGLRRLTLYMPFGLNRRSGRKQITLPQELEPSQGQTVARRPWGQAVMPLQQALVRSHRWLALRASGAVKT